MSIPDKTIENVTGGGTLLLATSMRLMEWMNLAKFNDLIFTITGIGGLIFLVYKIRIAIIENKINKHKLKQYEDGNKDKDEDEDSK